MSEKTAQKKKMTFPHTLVIIFCMILFVSILTYIVPGGAYDRIEVGGRQVVDPASFHFVDSKPATIMDIFASVPEGMTSVAYIANFVLIISGAFSVISSTGALSAVLAKVLQGKAKKMGAAVLPFVIIAFSALPAATGNAESMLAFVPLGIMFARSMGFDAMVGLSVTIAAGNCGFASGLFNAATTGTAQSLLGIEPLFTGWQFRAIGYVLLLCSVSFWTVWYALRIQKDPSKSICADVEALAAKNGEGVAAMDDKLDTRRLIILVEFVIGIAFVIYGALNGWTLKREMPATFLMMAVVIGFTAGYGPNRIAEEFCIGARKVLVGFLVVGFSKAIALIMTNAGIIDTIIWAFSGVLDGMPKVVGAVVMYLFQIVMNCFIISGSGQATATIPIMGPLGDILGLSPHTVVTAFIFGDGLTNLLLPMSAATMGAVGIAGITYPQYVKYIWRIILTNLCLGGVMVVISTMIH